MPGKLRDDQIRWILSLDAKGVQGELVQVSSAIGRLKKENADLSKEMKAAEQAMNEAEKAMIRLEDAGKTNTKQYQYAKESYNSNAQALVELQGKIDQNNKSIEEEKAKFEELTKKLQLNDMTMNQLRQRAADLQKQLNMTSVSVDPEAYKKLQQELARVNDRMFTVQNTGKSLLSQFAAMNNPIGSAAQAVQGFGQALKLLLANPVVAIISAIVAIFMALKDTISKNEEAMNSLNRIMAPLKTLLDWFLNTIMQAVNWVLKFVETLIGGLAKLAEWLPFVGDKMKELNQESEKAVELERDKQKLLESHRKNIVDISEKESKIAKLRADAAQKDVYSAKQRIQKLEEAKDLELEIIELKKQEAQAEIKILNKATDKVKATIEWKDQMAEALANFKKLDTEFYTRQRMLERTIQSAKKEDQRDAEAAAKKAMENQLKEIDKNLSLEINLQKKARMEGLLTEKEYNDKVEELTTASIRKKMEIKGQEKYKLIQYESELLDAQIKQQEKADKILLEELTKTKNNQLALLESKKNTRLEKLQEEESDQKIYALRAAEIESEYAQQRLDTIRAFGQSVEKAEFANAKTREDAVTASGKEIITAETANLNEQDKLRKLFAKTTADFERQYNIKTWEQRKEDELRILEKEHDEKLMSEETYQIALKAIEKKYADEKLKVREQYGLTTLKEQYNSELELLQKQHEKGLLSEEEYQKALLDIKLKYAQEYAGKAEEFAKIGSDTVKAFADAETATLNAEYTKRQSDLTEQYNQGLISQEEYNAQKEQLDYEEKKKELDIQKKYADVNFAMQAAEIISSGATAAINAYKALAGIPIVGPTLGAAAAALVALTTGLRLKQAKAERDRVKAMTLEAPDGGGSAAPRTGQIRLKEGFAEGGYNLSEGGYTRPGGKYEVAGYLPVHSGEYVIASDELKQPVIMNMARAIEKERQKRIGKSTVSGLAEGGSNTPGVDSDLITANGNMVLRILAVLDRLEAGDITVQTHYGITEMEAEQKRKMEAESKFTKR